MDNLSADLANYDMDLDTLEKSQIKHEAEQYAIKRRIVALLYKMHITDDQCKYLLTQKNLLDKLYKSCEVCDSYYDMVTRDAIYFGIVAIGKHIPNKK